MICCPVAAPTDLCYDTPSSFIFVDRSSSLFQGNHRVGKYHHSPTYKCGQRIGQRSLVLTPEATMTIVLLANASVIERAHNASVQWCKSSVQTRLLVPETLLQFVLENMESIARICARDTGKTSQRNLKSAAAID